MDNLFVYGMLLFEDEDPSHGIDTKRHIDKTKRGWVEGRLYVVEGFPFLVPEGEHKVKGKLLKCNDIDTLLQKYDVIEGANQPDPFFEREVVTVNLENGDEEKAYCYVGGRSLRDCFAKERYLVETGDWLDTNP